MSGDRVMWACDIMHAKSRKSATNTAERKRMIALLERKAEEADKTAVETLQNIKMVTPSSAPPVARQETVLLQQPHRSARDGECSGRVI